MAKNPSRLGRIADQIQKDLAELIRTEVKDPRVGMITLTGVEISSDHHHAKVFFTTLGGPESVAKAADGLQHAAGFLRSQLARGLKKRFRYFATDCSTSTLRPIARSRRARATA